MAQFASASDLAARLGVTLTLGEQSRADTLLGLASGLIQREARQTISEVDGDVLNARGVPESRFRLPERPVLSVSSVVLDGVALTSGTDWYLSGDCLVRGIGAGAWVANWGPGWGQGWGRPDQTLTITYSHGYAAIPDAIRAICVEQVVRAWTNPANLMHEYFGSERIVYAMQQTPTGLMLNADEQRVIHDVLRRTTASVALR